MSRLIRALSSQGGQLVAPVLAAALVSAAANTAPPPPTAAELTLQLAACPEFSPDTWPVVDELHDRLIAEWRTLAISPAALEAQRALEDRYADDLGAAAGLSPGCISSMKLAMEEAWLRRRLAELRVETSIPATEELIVLPDLRRRPEVTVMRGTTIRALRAVLAGAERQLGQSSSPRSSSVLAPSEAELAAIQSCAKCVEAISGEVGSDVASRMRARLAAAVVRSPRDRYLARAELILRALPGLNPEQKKCVDLWVEKQRAIRASAGQQFAALVIGQQGDERKLVQLLHECTSELRSVAELDDCLPKDLAPEVRALIGHWYALPDPMSVARGLISEPDANALLELEGVVLTPVPMLDVTFRSSDAGFSGYEALWRTILCRDLRPTETQLLRGAFDDWVARQLPKVSQALGALSECAAITAPDDPLAAAKVRLEVAAAESNAVRCILESEGGLSADWPAGSIPAGAESLARLERLSSILSTLPQAHLAAIGMQYPLVFSPLVAISQAELPDTEREKALGVCFEHAGSLLRSVQVLFASVADARFYYVAGGVEAAESELARYPGLAQSLIPRYRDGKRPEESECWRAVRGAWDAWLRECDDVRRALRTVLGPEAADLVVTRWLIACFPVLRDLTDVRDLLGADPRPNQAEFRRLVRASLRDLEGSAFGKRTGSVWSEMSAEVARITTAFEQLRFDNANLKERERRVRKGS